MTNRIQTADEAMLELLRDQRQAQIRIAETLARIEAKVDAAMAENAESAEWTAGMLRTDRQLASGWERGNPRGWVCTHVSGHEDETEDATYVHPEAFPMESGLGGYAACEAHAEAMGVFAKPNLQPTGNPGDLPAAPTSGAGEAQWYDDAIGRCIMHRSPDMRCLRMRHDDDTACIYEMPESQRDGARHLRCDTCKQFPPPPSTPACPDCGFTECQHCAAVERHAATWKALAKRLRRRAAADLKRAAPQDVTAAVEAERARCEFWAGRIYWTGNRERARDVIQHIRNGTPAPAQPATVGERKLADGWERGSFGMCVFQETAMVSSRCTDEATFIGPYGGRRIRLCEKHAQMHHVGVFVAPEAAPYDMPRDVRSAIYADLPSLYTTEPAPEPAPVPDVHMEGCRSQEPGPQLGPSTKPCNRKPYRPDAPRWERFNNETGALYGGNEHRDRCICQCQELGRNAGTPHKHRAQAPHACARCECARYRPAILEPIATPPAEPAPCAGDCGRPTRMFSRFGNPDAPKTYWCTPACRDAGRALRPSKEGTP